MSVELAQMIVKLSNLGYRQYQIDEIIKETVGTLKIEELNSQQSMELKQALGDYVSFAMKCRNGVK